MSRDKEIYEAQSDLTPGKYYFRKDAELCIESAQQLLERVERQIRK